MGDVERFATITPRVVRLNGHVGDALKATVTIVPESKYPFSIKKVRAQRGDSIKYDLKENTSDKGVKIYTLSIENIKKGAGSYYDVIILETDSDIQSELKLNVMARITDPDAPASKKLTSPASKDSAKKNAGSFLEVIQEMQKKQKLEGANNVPAPNQDPERAKELKKKFEELIKKAQEQKKAQGQKAQVHKVQAQKSEESEAKAVE